MPLRPELAETVGTQLELSVTVAKRSNSQNRKTEKGMATNCRSAGSSSQKWVKGSRRYDIQAVF